ncbi:DUF5107 domain-containing protein [Streptomyces sp. NPDC014870]|uniref:DUF5107 domain-containing protein n=1 Tax=Streptomyces sp. NPDC014870 TaxID=3364925 RepID=UPI003701A8F5
MTTVRRAVLTLPAAPLGPDNPLPALRVLDGTPAVDPRAVADDLPRDMARQLGYAPLRTVLPAPVRDGYGRARVPTDLDAIVIENDRVRATVLPGLGGRVHSLHHKAGGRELVHRNPVFQPAAFALNGAWFAGGIEWNIGATGHTTLSCSPVHAAIVPAPGGGQMLRLWEWERLRDLPFQVDLWLPEGSDFLHVGVRIRNPHERTVPVYWWSNTAVPEDRRILAPAETAFHHGYERGLRRVPVPVAQDGTGRSDDRTYPLRSALPADYFYDVPETTRRWIAALDETGAGLVQTSTDLLRGRKLFLWGTARGGRRWQEWLTAPGAPGYAEIQAGLARTQLEHLKLEGGAEFSWLETYGPLAAEAGTVHGEDWTAARADVEHALEAALPRAAVDAAYASWREAAADAEPVTVLATGSGWGALEVLAHGHELPGTPFPASTLGEEQKPWLELLRTGVLPPLPEGPEGPEGPGGALPGPSLVADHWRDMLETATPRPLTEYHLGIAQWAAGDLAQAVRSWERGLRHEGGLRWPLLYCLAVADQEGGHPVRSAERFAEAFEALGAGDSVVRAALGREAVTALLAAGRVPRARALLERLPEDVRGRGAFRLLEARLLLAEGRKAEARAVFDTGFEVADLREGAETLGELWSALTDEPLPDAYEFRMRP